MAFPDWVYRWFLDTHGEWFDGILQGSFVYECNYAILRVIELLIDTDLGMGNDAAFVRTATECLYDTLSDEDRERYGAHR